MARTEIMMEVQKIKCEGCAETITGVLRTVKGVHDVRVDVGRKRVTVTFDPAATDLDALWSQIRLAGF
jgi:copper chaperone CopZ